MNRIPKTFRQCKSNYNTTSILDIPNEVIIDIFAMLPKGIIVSTIPKVCERWNSLSKRICLWNKVHLNKNMSKRVVSKCITSMAPHVKHLVVKDRRDLSNILKRVSRKCMKLEKLEIHNCRGSASWSNVHSLPMCNLIKNCHRLRKIQLLKTGFKSQKFFQLLPQKQERSKRRMSYVGPITWTELLLFALYYVEYNCKKHILVGPRAGHPKNAYTLKNAANCVQGQQTEIGLVLVDNSGQLQLDSQPVLLV